MKTTKQLLKRLEIPNFNMGVELPKLIENLTIEHVWHIAPAADVTCEELINLITEWCSQ